MFENVSPSARVGTEISGRIRPVKSFACAKESRESFNRVKLASCVLPSAATVLAFVPREAKVSVVFVMAVCTEPVSAPLAVLKLLLMVAPACATLSPRCWSESATDVRPWVVVWLNLALSEIARTSLFGDVLGVSVVLIEVRMPRVGAFGAGGVTVGDLEVGPPNGAVCGLLLSVICLVSSESVVPMSEKVRAREKWGVKTAAPAHKMRAGVREITEKIAWFLARMRIVLFYHRYALEKTLRYVDNFLYYPTVFAAGTYVATPFLSFFWVN